VAGVGLRPGSRGFTVVAMTPERTGPHTSTAGLAA